MEDSDYEKKNGSVENPGKVKKKHKKRQKKVLADLQKQIEFYFSQPNLQKDRFLRQKLSESENGCVEIETIASFNRMKDLCANISLIIKAMKLCPSVEVIDDRWVKPSQPLSEPKNVDALTVYVERLPTNADHEWIKSRFLSCGNVVYVSLPRYKNTRDIKGFAFVEFEKESEAKAALEMFAEKLTKEDDGEENKTENDEEPREEVTGKQNKKNKKRKTKLSESEHEDPKVKSKKVKRKREDGTIGSISDPGETGETKKQNKRIIEDESSEVIAGKKTKRKQVKVNEGKGDKEKESSEQPSESDDTSEDSKKKRKRKRCEPSDNECTSSKRSKGECDDEVPSSKNGKEDGETEVNDEEMEDKKKKRKRKKNKREEVEDPQLRVISKLEWLTLKKEYQKLQRAAMKEAKAKLKIEFEERTEQRSKPNEEYQDESNTQKEIKSRENNSNLEKEEPPQKLEMQAGVVLKFSTQDNIDKRQIRNVFSAISPVAYLEKEGDSNTGHVRFATKEACDKVVETFSNNGSMENIKIESLTEKEDVEYWERLNNDRLERFHGKKRNRNVRGRQKITKKMDERNARKRDHVHFDD